MNKKLKKGILGLFAAVIMCLGSSKIEVHAADKVEMDPKKITIDCQNQQLIVDKSTSNKKIFFRAVPVKRDKKSGIRTIGTVEWDTYDTKIGNSQSAIGKDVVIDLSFLNRAKDNYIQIMGDQEREPITIHIPAVNSNLKAVFIPDKASVEIRTKKGQLLEDGIDIGKLEYRTKYSGWQQFDRTDSDLLSTYQQRGATLYVREQGAEAGTLDTCDLVEAPDMQDAEGKNIDLRIAGSFPGIDLKVNVKKLTSAPKISIDYVNMTMSIPYGALYRISFADGSEPVTNGDAGDGWITSARGKLWYRTEPVFLEPNVAEEDFRTLVEKGGTVEVKRKESRSKLPSKIGCYVVEAQRNYNCTHNFEPSEDNLNYDSITEITK